MPERSAKLGIDGLILMIDFRSLVDGPAAVGRLTFSAGLFSAARRCPRPRANTITPVHSQGPIFVMARNR